MGIPSGDTPSKAQAYYHYLQAHHETDGRVVTWHVDWTAIAWLWGFLLVIVLGLVWWVGQYRTTRQKRGIYPIDSWGGYTSEAAGPATRFFIFLTIGIVAFDAAIIIGHIVWGQKF